MSTHAILSCHMRTAHNQVQNRSNAASLPCLLSITMPCFDTDEQLHQCSMSLISVSHENWSDLSYRQVHRNDTLRLVRQLSTPLLLYDIEYRHLPLFFHLSAVLPANGHRESTWPGPGNTMVSDTVLQLHTRMGRVPCFEWQSIRQSLMRLIIFTQQALGEAVGTETLFSFSESGEMYVEVHDLRTWRQTEPASPVSQH